MRRLARTAFAALSLLVSLRTGAATLPPRLIAPLPDLTLTPEAGAPVIALAPHFEDPEVPGPAVRVAIRLGVETRHIDLALLPDAAPRTVANFLAYVDAGRYAANFFHRSVRNFVIQNGGFRFVNDTTFDYVATSDPVPNEPGVSNTRGTVAMAKLGDNPDSATSQWFINLGDNSSNLDAQNGGFTVFARVLGDGMTVADAIAALPAYDATPAPFYLPWNELPLTAAYLARPSFVETSVARVAPLAFSVSVDDPALLGATLDGTSLALLAASDRAGTTTVRVTATDLEGGVFTASFQVTVMIGQTITFAALDDLAFGATLPLQRTLVAEADSGLPVSFELVSGPATLSGSTLTLLQPGEVTLRATQAGDATHLPAAPVERRFTVRPFANGSLALEGLSKVFNGGPQTVAATPTPSWASHTITYAGSTAAPTNAGSYAVVATIDDPRVDGTPSAEGTLTIARRALTLTARGSMLQGSLAAPVLELVSIPDESPLYLPADPVLRCAAKAASAPGTYPITLDPIETANYDLALVPGTFVVAPLAATYEAASSAFGFARITVSRNRRDYTGVLELVDEARPVAIRGSLRFSPDHDAAYVEWTRPENSSSHPRALHTFRLSIGPEAAARFLRTNPTNTQDFGAVPAPRRRAPSGENLPAWAGAYGLLLDDLVAAPSPTAYPDALGIGHATAKIDKTGALALRGRLGDARVFTAAIPLSDDAGHRFFVRPYGLRNGGYFFGLVFTRPHPALTGRRLLEPYGEQASGNEQTFLAWAPPQGPQAVYGGAYDERFLVAELDPWLPPAAAKRATATRPAQPAVTLAQRLGLAPASDTGLAALGLDYFALEGTDLTAAQIELLPAALSLSPAGKALPLDGRKEGFKFSIDSATGAFSGSFVVSDQVPSTRNPGTTRLVSRKIPFTGMLRQIPSPAPSGTILGAGQFVVSPLDGSEQQSAPATGELRLTVP